MQFLLLLVNSSNFDQGANRLLKIAFKAFLLDAQNVKDSEEIKPASSPAMPLKRHFNQTLPP